MIGQSDNRRRRGRRRKKALVNCAGSCWILVREQRQWAILPGKSTTSLPRILRVRASCLLAHETSIWLSLQRVAQGVLEFSKKSVLSEWLLNESACQFRCFVRPNIIFSETRHIEHFHIGSLASYPHHQLRPSNVGKSNIRQYQFVLFASQSHCYWVGLIAHTSH